MAHRLASFPFNPLCTARRGRYICNYPFRNFGRYFVRYRYSMYICAIASGEEEAAKVKKRGLTAAANYYERTLHNRGISDNLSVLREKSQ